MLACKPCHKGAAVLPNWLELASMTDAELARLDIAVVNLACSLGAPGSEQIDVERCLHTLDSWTDIVRRWTDAAYLQYFLRNPADYDNSEAKFRIASMASALRQRCGLKYDPRKTAAGPEVPFEFHEQFVHGVLQGPGGTCATLPVVYASVGRRLGYPIRLAATRRHLFCRWDDPDSGAYFNIEPSCKSYEFTSDDHYREWPLQVGREEERAYGYITSWTPRRELANFVGQRAFVFRDNRRYREAVDTFVVAAKLTPGLATYPVTILATMAEWKAHLQGQYPPRFPQQIEVILGRTKRRWPFIPWRVEREIAALHTIEWCLHHATHVKRWWEPLRHGRRPLTDVPTSIRVDYELVQGA